MPSDRLFRRIPDDVLAIVRNGGAAVDIKAAKPHLSTASCRAYWSHARMYLGLPRLRAPPGEGYGGKGGELYLTIMLYRPAADVIHEAAAVRSISPRELMTRVLRILADDPDLFANVLDDQVGRQI